MSLMTTVLMNSSKSKSRNFIGQIHNEEQFGGALSEQVPNAVKIDTEVYILRNAREKKLLNKIKT